MEKESNTSNNAAISSSRVLDENQQADTSISNICLNAESTASELLQEVQKLHEKNQKLEHKFNNQRAKMLELFKQTEGELNTVRNNLEKAKEENISLQQLLQEKMHECTVCKSDIQRLQEESVRLVNENRQLRQSIPTHELSSFAPQVFQQVGKSLVRKLTGDNHSLLGINLDENETDGNRSKFEEKYANEDSEVLRPIVAQLQEEIEVLKIKLRETDNKLQSKLDSSIDIQSNELVSHYDKNQLKCANYEDKIKTLREKSQLDQKCIESLKRQIEEYNKDLEKEAALRQELEKQWQDNREAHRKEVDALKEKVDKGENRLRDVQQEFLETKYKISRELLSISSEREKVHKQLETLQADNDFLSGRYVATAEEIENQYINLPNKVEELQELILKQQQDLIKARLGWDYEKKRCISALDEIQLLRDQLNFVNSAHITVKKEYQTDIKSLQDRITEHLKTLQNSESAKVELERREAELNRQLSDMRLENDNLTKLYSEATAKIKNLRSELATSVIVQQDFVQLSQNLQMSLEQLRVAEKEVRWQDEDDVFVCPNCKDNFTVTLRKVHCRHCGRIYCDKCLTKTVESGPRKQPARVCDICHTLLLPNTAPYFSQEASGSQQSAIS